MEPISPHQGSAFAGRSPFVELRVLVPILRDRWITMVAVADAPATAAACDGTIVVVRHGKTKREQVHNMMDALRTVDAQLVGSHGRSGVGR
jgi:nucleotide-binding universal stress UspA family protein